MKYTYKLILAILATVLLLCSCSTAVETPTPETTPTETPTQTKTPMPTSVEDIGQIVYYEEEDDVGYTLDKFKNSKYRDEKNGIITINETLGPRVVEEDVPKKISWSFLGNDFELEYKYSTVYSYGGRSWVDDVYIDCYEIYHASVYFLHGTTQPIDIFLSQIDNWPSDLETYEDYLDTINYMLGNYVDIENYDVRCKTTYKNQSGETEHVDGFYKVKPGENMDTYWFDFTMTMNDVKTDDIIYVYFNIERRVISLCCHASKYDSEKISEINQREINYACLLTNEFIKKYNPNETIRKSAHFSGVDMLNDKLYLVINVTVPWYAEDDNLDNDISFYVDYERLQWKMALEGKN